MNKKSKDLTVSDIKSLVQYRHRRFSNYLTTTFCECYVSANKRFTWFLDDDGVYLYTNDRSLKHVGTATSFNGFVSAIHFYLNASSVKN